MFLWESAHDHHHVLTRSQLANFLFGHFNLWRVGVPFSLFDHHNCTHVRRFLFPSYFNEPSLALPHDESMNVRAEKHRALSLCKLVYLSHYSNQSILAWFSQR